MVDYRIEITDDEGTKLPPILFNDAGNLDFEAVRITAETLGHARNVLHAHLITGGEPEPSVRIIWCRSAEEPEQPSGDSLPAGWGDELHESDAPAWTSSAPYRGGTRTGEWSPKQRVS
ncbi:hypothetical protein [Sphingomonas leidyi]|uniref:hypothetical protein n=1 Tax=Sphingomonas leidyi TaxID=68569 RepID=UPI0036D2B269